MALAWKFVDPIRHVWDADPEGKSLTFYPTGSWGPKEADRLLIEHGAHWWGVNSEQITQVSAASVK